MSQQQERLPFFLNCEALGTAPLAAFEPWLKAQSGMVASLRQMTDHWCERRAGDIATLQETAARLAGCTTPQSALETRPAVRRRWPSASWPTCLRGAMT